MERIDGPTPGTFYCGPSPRHIGEKDYGIIGFSYRTEARPFGGFLFPSQHGLAAPQESVNKMRILDFLRAEGIICPLSANSKEEVLKELVEPIAKAHPDLDKGGLVKILLERENLGSTGIGGGVAIPHGKYEGLQKLASSFGKSPKGIDFSSMDSKPAHIFFLLVAPKNCAGDHLKALARISRLLKDPLLLSSLQKAESAVDIYRVLEEYDLRLP